MKDTGREKGRLAHGLASTRRRSRGRKDGDRAFVVMRRRAQREKEKRDQRAERKKQNKKVEKGPRNSKGRPKQQTANGHHRPLDILVTRQIF